MGRHPFHLVGASLLALVLFSACGAHKSAEIREAEKQLPEEVDFNWHVRPILSDKCFACHGPDRNKRQAGLRLDVEDMAKGELPENPGARAIEPGRLSGSELWRRITSDDPEVRMPPPESNLTLAASEIATLGRWIEQGAVYKPYWALIPPERPAVPKVRDEKWPRNAIDHFVLARLEREGLQPKPAAEKERLLRRLSLDLTGLPPSLQEIEAFLADTSPDAYEKAIDRLLASPHYGEALALDWLDLARYADSHGYSQDGYRMMWPWRDWVIRSFNENQPFDEFVTWQVAGDLLPRPTTSQLLATAFYRNSRINSEGGIVPEEYRVEYAAERTNLTGTVFLGLTLECARCHDHKYDPVSQDEYYRLFSFFNSVNEAGLVQKDGNSGPQLLISDSEADSRLAELSAQIGELEGRLQAHRQEVGRANPKVNLPAAPPKNGLVAYFPLDRLSEKSLANLAGKRAAAKISGEPRIVEGRVGSALEVGAYDFASLGEIADFDRADPFSLGLWVRSSVTDEDFPLISNLAGKNEGYFGYQLYLAGGRPSFRLVHGLPADLIQITAEQALPLQRWTHLTATYDGSGRASGLKLFIDGRAAPVRVDFDQLQRSIRLKSKTLRLGGSSEYSFYSSRSTAQIDEVKIFERRLTGIEAALLGGLPPAGAAASAETVLEHYLEHNDPVYAELTRRLAQARSARFKLQDERPGVMVMQDLPQARDTFVLRRGAYDAPGEKVQAGTPGVLHSFDESWPRNRLGLARWLVSQDNPLLARVAVNRFWQRYFGRAIVATPDDFGNQGQLPSHPELLDWLAREFVESGWNVKHMQKLIVMSSAYRQSSRATEQDRQRDPDNVLFSRGPSYRLPAELIRDNALAAAGLLVRDIGGESFKPYQPEGLWTEKNTFSDVLKYYVQDHGDKLYRRSMYIFWRRTSPPPNMSIFGAPTRDFCAVRRPRTNTPLQALVLMNDPQFVEAARVLGQRMMEEGGATPEERIMFAYRRLTGSRPEARMVRLLSELYAAERAAFQEDRSRAEALLKVGEYPGNPSVDPVEQAACAVVASAIMNLDETVTKR